MSYRPTGRRVLVKPDAEPTETASGLHIPDVGKTHRPMSGIVVALGPLCAGPADTMAHEVVKRCLARLEAAGAAYAAIQEALADVAHAYAEEAHSGLKVGQAVAFPYTVGTIMPTLMNVQIGEDAYLLIDERDIVAVWDPAQTTVAA